MKEKQATPNATEQKNGNDTTTEKFVELLVLTLQFADMVLITAPTFAEGSHGARVVATARTCRPKLAEMLAAEKSKKS